MEMDNKQDICVQFLRGYFNTYFNIDLYKTPITKPIIRFNLFDEFNLDIVFENVINSFAYKTNDEFRANVEHLIYISGQLGDKRTSIINRYDYIIRESLVPIINTYKYMKEGNVFSLNHFNMYVNNFLPLLFENYKCDSILIPNFIHIYGGVNTDFLDMIQYIINSIETNHEIDDETKQEIVRIKSKISEIKPN